MRATVAFEFGWCGFGAAAGLVPEVRLGLVRIWWCRGSIYSRVEKLNAALRDAITELRRKD